MGLPKQSGTPVPVRVFSMGPNAISSQTTKKTTTSTIPPCVSNYGLWIQHATPADVTLLLNWQQTKFMKELVGTFLYYTQAVKSVMLTALTVVAMKQAKPTTIIMQHMKQFLHYAATNSEVMIT